MKHFLVISPTPRWKAGWMDYGKHLKSYKELNGASGEVWIHQGLPLGELRGLEDNISALSSRLN